MSRWIAASLVVLITLAFAAAQDEKPLRFPLGGSKSQLPFDVIEQDGKTAWRVAGRGNLRAEELVAGLSSATNLRITYDKTGADYARNSVSFVGPDSGMVVPNDQLADYASDLLASADLTLVGHSTGSARVVRISDAPAYATIVTSAELEKLPPSEWASFTHTGLSADAFPSRLFEHFKAASVLIREQDGMLLVSGRAAEIRNVAKLLETVSGVGSDGMKIVSYDLAASIKATDAARVVTELFPTNVTSVDDLGNSGYRVRSESRRDVTVTVVPNVNRILVRAGAADHSLVKTALDALK